MFLAREYGIAEALILKQVYYWVLKNKESNKNFYDGKFWTYNTIKAYQEMFPYLSIRQLRYSFDKLINKGLILKKHLSKQRDRTCWYTLTDKGFAICQNCQMHLSIVSNGIDKIDKSINKDTNIDTNIIPERETGVSQKQNLTKEQEEFILEFKKLYPEKDCNIAKWPENIDLAKLLQEIKQSDFLQTRNNLDLNWCLTHYEEIVNLKKYRNHEKSTKNGANFKQREYSDEELKEYFAYPSIDEIKI